MSGFATYSTSIGVVTVAQNDISAIELCVIAGPRVHCTDVSHKTIRFEIGFPVRAVGETIVGKKCKIAERIVRHAEDMAIKTSGAPRPFGLWLSQKAILRPLANVFLLVWVVTLLQTALQFRCDFDRAIALAKITLRMQLPNDYQSTAIPQLVERHLQGSSAP